MFGEPTTPKSLFLLCQMAGKIRRNSMRNLMFRRDRLDALQLQPVVVLLCQLSNWRLRNILPDKELF